MSNPDYFCRKSKNRNVLQERTAGLHFIKNHKATVSCPSTKVFTRKKSHFIFSYTQIVEFLFSRCFDSKEIRTRQFSAGPLLTSEVGLGPRSQFQSWSLPTPGHGFLPSASKWESLKELIGFKQKKNLRETKIRESKTNVLWLAVVMASSIKKMMVKRKSP